MSPSSERSYDLVILGATGFTGRLVCEALAGQAPTIRWAIAGRSRERLEALRAQLGPAEIGIEELELGAPDRLRALVGRARVVLNLIGPYLRTGLAVVEACVEQRTHYCDLAGELPFMRASVERFHAEAAARGVRIVHACGYDCVPSDLGLLLAQDALAAAGQPPALTVTTYIMSLRGAMSGGSAASVLVQGELDADVLARSHAPRALNPASDPHAPGGREADADRPGPSFDRSIGQWTTPFFMVPINTRVVRRSVALLGDPWGPSFCYREAMAAGAGIGGRLRAAAMHTGMKAMLGLARARWGRALLGALLPKPGGGPSMTAIERGHFAHLVVPTLADGRQPLVVHVGADEDPGYGATRRMVVACALRLCDPELRSPAGVITPAVAFGLELVDDLRAAGLRFEVEAR